MRYSEALREPHCGFLAQILKRENLGFRPMGFIVLMIKAMGWAQLKSTMKLFNFIFWAELNSYSYDKAE